VENAEQAHGQQQARESTKAEQRTYPEPAPEHRSPRQPILRNAPAFDLAHDPRGKEEGEEDPYFTGKEQGRQTCALQKLANNDVATIEHGKDKQRE